MAFQGHDDQSATSPRQSSYQEEKGLIGYNGMTDDNGFHERLRRVERVLCGDEEITQKQAMLLLLDLAAQNYDMNKKIRDEGKDVKKTADANKVKIEVLETRITVGIGLTVLVGIIASIKLVLGL